MNFFIDKIDNIRNIIANVDFIVFNILVLFIVFKDKL